MQYTTNGNLLFLFFIIDILTHFKQNIGDLFSIDELKLSILLFADDTVLFWHSPQALPSILNDLHHYCTTWTSDNK